MYIVSMTTVPSRKKRLEENIESILNQTYKFDKLVINIDDNLSQEDIDWYKEFAKKDSRIEIGFGEAKWRSCNKLLPTIKKYPDDVIITIDDDVYYPDECVERLVKKHIEYPDVVVAHEINPLIVNKKTKTLFYFNSFDIKLEQIEYGKYLSNCSLFPPHIFDNTDLYDYDKMMMVTKGNHDEYWFWINSTLNHVKSIGLDYIYTFSFDVKSEWQDEEYRLSNINNKGETIQEYANIFNKTYGKQIYDIVTSEPVVFFVTQQNSQLFLSVMHQIAQLYNYGIKLKFDKNVTSGYRNLIKDFFQKHYQKN